MASMEQRMKHETELRDYAIARIENEIPYCRLNGDRVKRVPNNINFSFQFVEGESLLIMLDMKGICASQWFSLYIRLSGSISCSSGKLDYRTRLHMVHFVCQIGADTTKEDN